MEIINILNLVGYSILIWLVTIIVSTFIIGMLNGKMGDEKAGLMAKAIILFSFLTAVVYFLININ